MREASMVSRLKRRSFLAGASALLALNDAQAGFDIFGTFSVFIPALNSISPTVGSTAGSTAVTLTGINFTGATGVTFKGVAATSVVVVNATSITCVTPANTTGPASVIVTTTKGSNAANSLYTYQGAPTLNTVTASSGLAAGGLSVTLSGNDFTGATGVTFGGTAATSVVVVNNTTITCTTPAHAAGAVSVVVTTAFGSNGANTLFTYNASGTTPTVSAISDNGTGLASGSTAGNRPVTITGTNFISGATVTIGGTSATNVVVASATQITCRTGAHAAGNVSVVVTTSNGSNGANSLYAYSLGGLTAPAVASAQGYSTLSFQDEFTDLLGIDTANSLAQGFNFYVQSFGWTNTPFTGSFQASYSIPIQYMTSNSYPPYSFSSSSIAVSSSVLTLTGNTNRVPSPLLNSTAFVNNTAGYVGTTVNSANGFYIEARIAGEGINNGSSNAWWFIDNRALTGANTTQYLEFDIPEMTGGAVCNFNIIEWLPASSPGRLASGNPGSFVLDNNFHVYGCLYVPPAQAGGNGFVRFYVDGTLQVTVAVTTGSFAANSLASAQNQMILETDANTSANPLQVDYVRVWQQTPTG